MRTKKQRLALVLAILIVIFTGTLVVASIVTGQKRNVAVKQLRDNFPESVRIALNRPAPKHEPSPPEPIETPEPSELPSPVSGLPGFGESFPLPELDQPPPFTNTTEPWKTLFKKIKARLDPSDDTNLHYMDETQIRYIDNVMLMHADPNTWTDEQWQEFSTFFDEQQDLIAEIRRIAKIGGPIAEWPLSQGFDEMDMSHFGSARECGRLLAADAILQARRENYDMAVEDVLAGMDLADALGQEPTLISQIESHSLYGIMNDAVRDALSPGELPTELATQLIERAAQSDMRDEFAAGLAGEAAFALNQFEKMRTGQYEGPEEAIERAFGDL